MDGVAIVGDDGDDISIGSQAHYFVGHVGEGLVLGLEEGDSVLRTGNFQRLRLGRCVISPYFRVRRLRYIHRLLGEVSEQALALWLPMACVMVWYASGRAAAPK